MEISRSKKLKKYGSTTYFNDFGNTPKKDTALGGSVDDNLIMPYILLAQDMYILPILGTDLYNKLKTDIQSAGLRVLK